MHRSLIHPARKFHLGGPKHRNWDYDYNIGGLDPNLQALYRAAVDPNAAPGIIGLGELALAALDLIDADARAKGWY